MSKYLYQTEDPSELTAEQKDTISSITSITGTVIGASTGNVTDAVNAGETAKVAVEDNGLENVLLPHEIDEITNVWGTKTRPITKKDFDKFVESMSATLGFDVEDAAIHIFRPLLDSPVGAAAGLTVKITSSGIKITSKSGKVTNYTAKQLAQLNASRIASKNAASDLPSANIGSNLPVKVATSPTKNATNANAQAALKSKLSALQTAQNTAIKSRTLPDGRIRYYAQEKPASTSGNTRGASFVTEHNPKTGYVRQWMESYNHKGEVIRVNPKSMDSR
nr:VENN motif pre-toxin domain-containing protein [Psychrobacter sp. BF1]